MTKEKSITGTNPAQAFERIMDFIEDCEIAHAVRDGARIVQSALSGSRGWEVDNLAQFIRTIDGNNTMGAGELAERIIDHLASTGRIMGEWKPISEAPRDGARVLVWSDELYMEPYIAWWGVDQNAPEDGNEQEEWLMGDGDSWSTGYYYTPCKPTHWMPLPPAPKTECRKI